MNILLINSVYKKGSTGNIVYQMKNFLESKKHKVKIIYGRGEKVHEKNVIKIGNKLTLAIDGFLTRIFDLHGLGSLLSTRNVIKRIHFFRPDIVHLHNIHGYYLNYVTLFRWLKKHNIKVVWTLHDSWAYTGHCAYYLFSNCNKWKTECNKCPQKNTYPKSILIDNSRFNFNNKKKYFTNITSLQIVTPSRWLSEEIKYSYLGNKDIKVINNGIDTCIFNYNKVKRKDSDFVILCLANIWEKRKGIEFIEKLVPLLKKNEKLIIIGKLLKQYKIKSKNVIQINRTSDQNQLAEYYNKSDLFLNPTLEDNFPTTNLEAICCGLPVITFNSGGSSEMIDDTNGLIINEKSVNQIRLYIDKYKLNKTSYNRKVISENAISLYSNKVSMENYLNLFESI
jgi:putative colanic acid biosynthesis glycosyltransferase